MKVADLEKIIELSEYDESGVNIELSPDIDKKVQELTDIIKSVPMKIWEKLGYKGYTEVDVEKRDRFTYYKSIENITIVLKGDNIAKYISGVGIRNIFWDLAKYSKRYNEFCVKMCEWDIKWLKAQNRFINEIRVEETTKETITRLVDLYSNYALYGSYFRKLGLKRPVISFCLKHNITDEVTIAEIKKRFVLEAFVRMSLDGVNYFKNSEDYEYLIKYWNASHKDREKIYSFWDMFLNDYEDFKDLFEYADLAIQAVKKISTKDEFMVFEELKALDTVKNHVLYIDKKKPDYYSEYYYYGLCEGVAYTLEDVTLEKIISGEADKAREIIVEKKNGRKIYDYLCNRIEEYQALKKKSFDDFVKIITKDELSGIYTAELSVFADEQFKLGMRSNKFRGTGRTKKAAIANLKMKFENNIKDIIIRLINIGFSEYTKEV